MDSVIPDYSDVFEQLDKHSVRYVVIGSVAAVLHGYLRRVRDLDIVVSSKAEEANAAVRALAAAGFVSTIPLPVTMVSMLRLFDGGGREVNAMVRWYVPFLELYEQSNLVAVGPVSIRVASVPHLIQAKEATGLPADLDDVKHLADLLKSN